MASMRRTIARAMRWNEVASSRKTDRKRAVATRIKEWEKEKEHAEEEAQRRKDDPAAEPEKPSMAERFVRWLQRMGKGRRG